jgi:predicted DNA-binding transcriptional regulator AlpA
MTLSKSDDQMITEAAQRAISRALVEASQKTVARELAKAAAGARALWRFGDLKLLGIVNDRATVRRLIKNESFPQPLILSANSVAWRADEVRGWLDSRPRGAAPQPARPKKAA